MIIIAFIRVKTEVSLLNARTSSDKFIVAKMKLK